MYNNTIYGWISHKLTISLEFTPLYSPPKQFYNPFDNLPALDVRRRPEAILDSLTTNNRDHVHHHLGPKKRPMLLLSFFHVKLFHPRLDAERKLESKLEWKLEE